MITAGLSLSTAAVADTADDVTDGLIAWYPLDETDGSVAHNAAPDGGIGDGIVDGAPGWTGDQGFRFSGGANGSGNAIALPDDINVGLGAISVSFDVLIAPSQKNWYMMWAIGNRGGDGNGQRYIFASGDEFNASITPAGSGQEQRVRSGGNLERGVWKHVTYTLSGSTAVLYENGVERHRRTDMTVSPDDLGSTTFNHLGRSVFQGDQSFEGNLRDFRIYDRALSQAEVSALAEDVLAEAVQADADALDLGDTSRVIVPLDLPARGANGSSISGSSDNTAVLGHDGSIHRPETATTVVLTATLRKDSYSTTRDFSVTVPAKDDEGDAQALAEMMTVPRLDDVRENLALPAQIAGHDVEWSSSDPDTVAADGTVQRPAHGAEPVEVDLTATVTVGAASATRHVTAVVKPLPKADEKAAYLFAYFTGQGAENERIRYAISRGNDILDWTVINDDQPVLSSELGERGLRDPFLIRSPEGDRFYLIATDLNTSTVGIQESQEFGSRHIEVWESTDLVNWSDQRHVPVAPENAGNAWAPEAFYDAEAGHYVVFWASNLWPSTDPSVPRAHEDNYNRMMYATTRDFRTFSEPQVWIDEQQPGRGNGMIDSTIIEEDGWLYRFTVEEDINLPRVDRTQDLYDAITPENNPWKGTGDSAWEVVQERVGYGAQYVSRLRWPGQTVTFTQGEGATVLRPNPNDVHGPDGVYAFIDQADYYGGEGYVPFKASSVAVGDWTIVQDHDLPLSPRHGTVLPISVAEYEGLLAAHQPELLVSSDPVTVTTTAGEASVLPESVHAVRGLDTDDEEDLGEVAVGWYDVDSSDYSEPGEFIVHGTIPGDGFATAIVTVVAADDVEPQFSVTADARCVAGKVVQVVRVGNEDGVPLSFTISSAFGSRVVSELPAERGSSAAFSSRRQAVAEGFVSVLVEGQVDGSPVQAERSVAAPALSCG